MDFWIFFPGRHIFFWIVPISLIFFRIIFPNPLLLLGALVSALLSLFFSFRKVVPVRIEEERAKEILKSGGKKPAKKIVVEVLKESFEKEERHAGLEKIKEKLNRAQQAEKKAKSALASFDRDLSSMNFRISELEETRKTQEMRISGLKGENELLHKMVRKLREEKKKLKERSMR